MYDYNLNMFYVIQTCSMFDLVLLSPIKYSAIKYCYSHLDLNISVVAFTFYQSDEF